MESANISRFEDDGTQTVVGAWWARGAPFFRPGANVPLDGETVTGKLRRTGRPQRVDDYSGVRGELVKRLREAGIESAVGAPVKVAGRIWGGIVARGGLRTPSPGDRNSASQLRGARHGRPRQCRRMSSWRLAAGSSRPADEERRRLGRDLHDGAQQELVGAVMSLKLAQRRWAQAPDEARDLVEEAIEQMQSGIRDLRELAAGIHPSVLTDRGLSAALEGLATRSGCRCRLACCPGPAAGPVETSAYFVVAEALTNAAKHARCSHVQVGVQSKTALRSSKFTTTASAAPTPVRGRDCADSPIASTRSGRA